MATYIIAIIVILGVIGWIADTFESPQKINHPRPPAPLPPTPPTPGKIKGKTTVSSWPRQCPRCKSKGIKHFTRNDQGIIQCKVCDYEF
ncbi:hypothetical protein BKI52_15890 [marine bacterium AO1-C]|nr:hypothetical protein BKI52_15890 [marine bacterium AO1-C]